MIPQTAPCRQGDRLGVVFMAKALLSLVLLLKDEAKSIEKMIECAAPAVDRVDILDTGSTDGTQEIARKACERLNLLCEIHSEAFVDFATSRNRSLKLAEEHAVFALWLSGDEYLHGPQELRFFCAQRQDQPIPGNSAFFVSVQVGNNVFRSPRIVRLGTSWRFIGVVHEVLACARTQDSAQDTICDYVLRSESWISHEGFNLERKTQRFYKDLELLRERHIRFPDDPRTLFYLAQTLQGLKFFADACRLYAQRAQMHEGWPEERFIAMYRAAQCADVAGFPTSEVQRMFLNAVGLRPTRAEPLLGLAEHCLKNQAPHVAYFFAAAAAGMTYPEQDAFCVEPNAYTWKPLYFIGITAIHAGQYEQGKDALKRLLESDQTEIPREAIWEQIAVYEQQIEALKNAPKFFEMAET